MKNIKKIITGLLILTTLAASLTACGKSEKSSSTSSSTTVKLGVVGSVYEELWAPAKAKLANEGINLQIVQFSDYTTPNNALNSGEIDLNAFQHQIYLTNEVKSYGYQVEKVGFTFIIPLNVYSKKVTAISQIKDGDTIAIPNDVTNGGRALKVLEAAGLIKIKSTAGFNPTVDDIETYKVKVTIKGLAANTIPSALEDVTAAVVNGNYALDFGLKTKDALFKDTSVTEDQYWNLIAARSSDLKDKAKVEVYEKVVKAFQTDDTNKVFNENYGGYFIGEGWDQNLLSKYK